MGRRSRFGVREARAPFGPVESEMFLDIQRHEAGNWIEESGAEERAGLEIYICESSAYR